MVKSIQEENDSKGFIPWNYQFLFLSLLEAVVVDDDLLGFDC